MEEEGLEAEQKLCYSSLKDIGTDTSLHRLSSFQDIPNPLTIALSLQDPASSPPAPPPAPDSASLASSATPTESSLSSSQRPRSPSAAPVSGLASGRLQLPSSADSVAGLATTASGSYPASTAFVGGPLHLSFSLAHAFPASVDIPGLRPSQPPWTSPAFILPGLHGRPQPPAPSLATDVPSRLLLPTRPRTILSRLKLQAAGT